MAHMGNLSNEYADSLGDLFDDCPKSVLAAIAVSALTCGGDFLDESAKRLADEWLVLYQQGVVSQRPSKAARLLAASAE
jgi:hypothetical protein